MDEIWVLSQETPLSRTTPANHILHIALDRLWQERAQVRVATAIAAVADVGPVVGGRGVLGGGCGAGAGTERLVVDLK